MTVHELSRTDARRIAVRAQLLDGSRPAELPILYGDRLVGKLDAAAEREAGVLRVHAVHQDIPFTTAMTAAVGREIKDLAHWLELDLTPPH
jgi:uncharacterized protein YcaQ